MGADDLVNQAVVEAMGKSVIEAREERDAAVARAELADRAGRRLAAAVESYISAQGACVDAEGMCITCHSADCEYCALAAVIDGPGCSEDCERVEVPRG